jgi:hypothetical protein
MSGKKPRQRKNVRAPAKTLQVESDQAGSGEDASGNEGMMEAAETPERRVTKGKRHDTGTPRNMEWWTRCVKRVMRRIPRLRKDDSRRVLVGEDAMRVAAQLAQNIFDLLLDDINRMSRWSKTISPRYVVQAANLRLGGDMAGDATSFVDSCRAVWDLSARPLGRRTQYFHGHRYRLRLPGDIAKAARGTAKKENAVGEANTAALGQGTDAEGEAIPNDETPMRQSPARLPVVKGAVARRRTPRPTIWARPADSGDEEKIHWPAKRNGEPAHRPKRVILD